ncbi:MAG: ATP-binding protein [Candidatus Moranbacteria bacterium]|jgi:predicted kinase|nr:ATP-binding protein [Candidatus Moranbacteria bacterium]
MSKLIIVCGLSGSGKTTLASELSKKLNIVCIHKDSIKETLYEAQNCSTLDDSKRLGSQSVELLLKLAEEHIKRNVDIVIESPFNFPDDYPLFESWIKDYGVDIFSVICLINKNERARRFQERERHISHHDAERIIDHLKKEFDYENIPGKQIRIETNVPVDELVKKVIFQLI